MVFPAALRPGEDWPSAPPRRACQPEITAIVAANPTRLSVYSTKTPLYRWIILAHKHREAAISWQSHPQRWQKVCLLSNSLCLLAFCSTPLTMTGREARMQQRMRGAQYVFFAVDEKSLTDQT